MGNAASSQDSNAFRNAMASLSASQQKMVQLGAGVWRGVGAAQQPLAMPAPESISFGGVFNEHYFKLWQQPAQSEAQDTKSQLVRTTCEYALPVCGASAGEATREAWLATYLTTALDGRTEDSRREIAVCVCLDVSGSMTDTITPPKTEEELMSATCKLDAAKQAINTLLGILQPGDEFGLVTFNEQATVVQGLCAVGELDKRSLINNIGAISAGGETSLWAGYKQCADMFSGNSVAQKRCQKRILFITDMCDSNPGQETAVFNVVKEQAERGVFTSVVGLGVDFNSAVAERVSSVPGANCFCVFSLGDFCRTLADEFCFNFFPCAFNVSIQIFADPAEIGIDGIYGSEMAEKSNALVESERWSYATHAHFPEDFKKIVLTLLLCVRNVCRTPIPENVMTNILNHISPRKCTIFQVNTIFPSPLPSLASRDGFFYLRGGGLLMTKLRLSKSPCAVRVRLHYTDRDGVPYGTESVVTLAQPVNALPGSSVASSYFYSGGGIRKAILLCGYVSEVKQFLANSTADSVKRLREFAQHVKSEVDANWPQDEALTEAVANMESLAQAKSSRDCTLQ